MSLLFSEVELTRSDGSKTVLRESGHPDETDLMELLREANQYAGWRAAVLEGATIQVRHYCFQSGGSAWLAERDHFALMDAYDQLALRHGEPCFLRCGAVNFVDGYRFTRKYLLRG